MKTLTRSVALVLCALIATSALAKTSYQDVPAGAWYEEVVIRFTTEGFLDAAQPRFRPNDTASRAEFVKLIVMLNGGVLSTPPASTSFDDVPLSHWAFGYFEEAAKETWVKGEHACYGSHPCLAHPNGSITRAEAAVLIARVYNLQANGISPVFVDNPNGTWYHTAIQTMADHCVLKGDDSTGHVRPNDFLKRAEMLILLDRADQEGNLCERDHLPVGPSIRHAVTTSAQTLEIEFTDKIDPASTSDLSHYIIILPGGSSKIPIATAHLLTDTTVELTLAKPLDNLCGTEYSVVVDDLVSFEGIHISDSAIVKGYCAIVEPGNGLEVGLSKVANTTPPVIRRGAGNIPMLQLDITSPCDDAAKINAMTVVHHGTGSALDLMNISAYVTGELAGKADYDAHAQTWRMKFEPSLVIPACKTVTLEIRGDIPTAAQPGSDHALMLELSTDVESDAKDVVGNFPILGPGFTIR